MIAGESVAKAAACCEVAYTTAFRWRHRFLMAPARDKPTRLVGIVEADETFILESFKGRRAGLPRASRKRGGKPKKTGLSAEQIPVLVARDRTGATIDRMLPKLDKASVIAVLAGVVTSANQLCCDGGKAITAFARIGGIAYHVLPKPGSPKPEAPHLHINNVNAYHSRLKQWLRPFDVPWGGDEEPASLPRLAKNDRSIRTHQRARPMTCWRDGNRSISTNNAIRATVIDQIMQDRPNYEASLRAADSSFTVTKMPDLAPMKAFLNRLLNNQMISLAQPAIAAGAAIGGAPRPQRALAPAPLGLQTIISPSLLCRNTTLPDDPGRDRIATRRVNLQETAQ